MFIDERSYNTTIFKDAEICQNEGCNEGFIYLPIWNEDENKYDHEKEKCPYCTDGFIND